VTTRKHAHQPGTDDDNSKAAGRQGGRKAFREAMLCSPDASGQQLTRLRPAFRTYDPATTPHQRAERHTGVCAQDKAIMNATLTELNPVAIQRRIQALTAELLT